MLGRRPTVKAHPELHSVKCCKITDGWMLDIKSYSVRKFESTAYPLNGNSSDHHACGPVETFASNFEAICIFPLASVENPRSPSDVAKCMHNAVEAPKSLVTVTAMVQL